MIKQQKRKRGEVEKETCVSTGYISRASKSSKPGIDFVVNAAKVFGVCLDTLLMVDLNGLDASEIYLLSFLTKLINDTTNDLLTWERGHEASVFESKSFGLDTKVKGDCYNVRLKNGAQLYIMNLERASAQREDKYKDRTNEIWLTMNVHKPEFLCSDWGRARLAPVVDPLYKTVMESFKRPQIDQACRDVIDAFLKDYMTDDTDTPNTEEK